MIDGLFAVDLEDEWASNYERLELIKGDPELRFAHQVETERVISEGTQFIADYVGIPADDLRLQTFVAAVSGVMFHLAQSPENITHEVARERLITALNLLEEGLPTARLELPASRTTVSARADPAYFAVDLPPRQVFTTGSRRPCPAPPSTDWPPGRRNRPPCQA